MYLEVISVFTTTKYLDYHPQKFSSRKLHIFFTKTNIIHTIFSSHFYLKLIH